ncbi:MAG: hypothetical protein AVDCRST_MAG68-1075 [uncultured Gemmatimonadetes bacterium]|uniref:Uncharacterized protein n=1 Tax=uncultured Gemmatimonadota bacterium TaxID=203437 RepID=A0A6J4KKD6_9BACT|nr:MAG: hypothetical protein AVDCRST_MAG68-1075 [uncultured Gemmatimonadota bacterium]
MTRGTGTGSIRTGGGIAGGAPVFRSPASRGGCCKPGLCSREHGFLYAGTPSFAPASTWIARQVARHAPAAPRPRASSSRASGAA